MAIPDYQPNSEVSEQLLAELMATGIGSFIRQAEEIVENKIEELDQQEEENDKKKCRACGIFHSVDIVFDGTHEMIVFLCRDYRHCENCRKQKWLKEIAPRLSYAHNHLPIGEWLKFVRVHDNDYEAYTKAISRYGGEHLNFPEPNRFNVLIHNAEGFGDSELYDFDEYEEGLDINFKELLANVPKGRRISGKLGKKGIIEKEEEGEGEIDENDKYEDVRVPHLHSPSATVRDVNIAYMKAVKDTQNISVKDQHELSQAMFARLEAMKKYLPEDAFIFYDVKSVGLKQSQQWNENPNNGVVHLTTIEVVHSNKTDKYTLSGVGKFFREIGMLDDLPFETAYDLVK